MNTTDVIPFASGIAYTCRSVCDHNCVWHFEVVSRTAKRVTLRELDSVKTVTVGISVYDGSETCFPAGRYSMAPILRAGR